MKKIIFLSLLFLISAGMCSELNDSANDSLIIDEPILDSPWHAGIIDNLLNADNTALIAFIIGLSIAYFLGKFAFRFIKIIIVVLIIFLLIRMIF
ncbi:MAG: hypothetical protein PHS81_03150 [Candidatus Nanoarchaeia archaeon]|nr:hypothetical protein [Candidatus Nanoarchaeia archaeon]